MQVFEISPGNHTLQFGLLSTTLSCQGAYASVPYYSAKLRGFQQKTGNKKVALAISFSETDSCQKALLPAEQDDFSEANHGNPHFARIYFWFLSHALLHVALSSHRKQQK